MKPWLFAPKKYLLLISGVMWIAVGIMLLLMASHWLGDLHASHPGIIIISGVAAGLAVSFFGFASIVNKNIQRIQSMEPRVSIFAFQAWHSYLLIIIMMSMGVLVRHSGLIPMILKTPGYFTIGTALSISSFKYFKSFLHSNP